MAEIKDIKDLLGNIEIDEILKLSLSGGGQFSELFFENKSFSSVVLEDGKIEEIVGGIDRGIGLRVINDGKTFFAHTNSFENKNLIELASGISSAISSDRYGRDLTELYAIKKEEHAKSLMPDFIKASLDAKVEKLKEAESFLPLGDKSLRHYRLVFSDSVQDVAIINSLDGEATDKRINSIFLVHLVVSDGELIQTGYEPVGGSEGFAMFSSISLRDVVGKAYERAMLILKAPKAPGGTMPVVLSSEAGGTMIHEAVGHGFEADYAQEGLSVYSHKKGELIASPLVTVADDPTLPGKRGTYRVDDEGTKPGHNVLIEKGVLKNYLYDRLSSWKDNVHSTGNGRRESYKCKPIPRMSNTFIKSGTHDPKEILSSTDSGLFVRKMGGGQVNPVNGDFIFEVSEGYLISGGKITTPVRGATLAGNGPKVLLEIDMVGNDLGFGIGTCGKDSQGVPVSDAQPTLRIKSIVVGGEASPQPKNQ
ncbi:MAG: TldD/PmbA family protein [Candidatus Schekmanbacteria bacterium]|nr:TldD/PmbA family protein [Candidatus Schekmanbacteria bacterium]